jgi:hypothetical protein
MKFKSLSEKHSRILLLVFFSAVLSLLLSSGCGFSASEVTDNSPAAPQDEITYNLNLLSDYLAEADDDYKNLEDFTWQGLDDLGYREIREAGQCCQTPRLCDKNDDTDVYSTQAVWMPILSWLPDYKRVSPLKGLIDSSQNTLNEIKSEITSLDSGDSPDYHSLSQSEAVNEMFTNLDGALKSAIYMVTTIDKTSNFSEVTALLEEADSVTQDRYREKFSEQSGKYTELLHILQADLEKAAGVNTDLMAKIAEPKSDR